MENFFIDDYFCSDISDLMDHLGIQEEDVKDLEEDWYQEVEETDLEKVCVITESKLTEVIWERFFDEDRLPEDPNNTIEKVEKAIKEAVDINKLNEAIPLLYYPNGTMVKITKQDLLDYIN